MILQAEIACYPEVGKMHDAMIDRTTLENMLKGLGITEDRVLQAVSVLMGDNGGASAGTTGGLFSVKQAQDYLGGISRWTIHRAVKTRELPRDYR